MGFIPLLVALGGVLLTENEAKKNPHYLNQNYHDSSSGGDKKSKKIRKESR